MVPLLNTRARSCPKKLFSLHSVLVLLQEPQLHSDMVVAPEKCRLSDTRRRPVLRVLLSSKQPTSTYYNLTIPNTPDCYYTWR